MNQKKGDLMDLGGILSENPPSGNPYVAWAPGVCGGIGGLYLTRGEFFLFYKNLIFFINSISRRPSVCFFNAPKKATKSPKPPFGLRLPHDSAIYSITHTNLTKEQDHAK
jgi:hypothetical protein